METKPRGYDTWVSVHYGTVSVHHLIRPNIGNVVHGVPSNRDLRMGTVWLIVCHGRLYTLFSRSCIMWDFELTDLAFPYIYTVYSGYSVLLVQNTSVLLYSGRI